MPYAGAETRGVFREFLKKKFGNQNTK